MRSTSVAALPDQAASSRSRIDRICANLLSSRLQNLKHGSVRLIDGDRGESFGSESPEVTIKVHDSAFYRQVVAGGSIGAAESYMDGHWSCDDLPGMVGLFVRNMDLLDRMEGGLALLATPARKALHWLNRNTRSGSRRNIAAHYDLGNELFKLFLDRNLMYSSAVYERPDMSLDEAADAKLDRICRKLDLSPSDHVLEIGTGWGGFALYAARHFGCRVTTTTISREQYELALQRVREAGLEDRITLLLQDYRDLEGQYDKLVSIEMIEAIGHRFMPAYFSKIGELLKPDGMMLLQAITIADQRYQQALKNVDFIQRYVFPGSFIPSVTAMSDAITASSDLKLFHLEDIGPHYARTLKEWRERFMSRQKEVSKLGYPRQFVRMWEFYLAYCEGGFEERALGDVQMLLVKPGCRRAPLVPSLS